MQEDLRQKLEAEEKEKLHAEMDAAAEREGKYVKTAQEQEADARKAQV